MPTDWVLRPQSRSAWRTQRRLRDQKCADEKEKEHLGPSDPQNSRCGMRKNLLIVRLEHAKGGDVTPCIADRETEPQDLWPRDDSSLRWSIGVGYGLESEPYKDCAQETWCCWCCHWWKTGVCTGRIVFARWFYYVHSSYPSPYQLPARSRYFNSGGWLQLIPDVCAPYVSFVLKNW
jgi:hypothetical protein